MKKVLILFATSYNIINVSGFDVNMLSRATELLKRMEQTEEDKKTNIIKRAISPRLYTDQNAPTQQDTNAAIGSKVLKLISTVEQLQQDNKELQKQLDAAITHIQEHKDHKAQIEGLQQAVVQKMQQIEAQSSNLIEQQLSTKKDIENVEAAIQELSKNEQYNQQCAELRSQINILHTNYQSLQQEQTESQERNMRSIREQLGKLQEAVTQQQNSMQNTKHNESENKIAQENMLMLLRATEEAAATITAIAPLYNQSTHITTVASEDKTIKDQLKELQEIVCAMQKKLTQALSEGKRFTDIQNGIQALQEQHAQTQQMLQVLSEQNSPSGSPSSKKGSPKKRSPKAFGSCSHKQQIEV